MNTQTEKPTLAELTKARGVCERYVWRWLLNGMPVTRAVNAAIKRGDLEASYYSGGRAAVNLTLTGRAKAEGKPT